MARDPRLSIQWVEPHGLLSSIVSQRRVLGLRIKLCQLQQQNHWTTRRNHQHLVERWNNGHPTTRTQRHFHWIGDSDCWRLFGLSQNGEVHWVQRAMDLHRTKSGSRGLQILSRDDDGSRRFLQNKKLKWKCFSGQQKRWNKVINWQVISSFLLLKSFQGILRKMTVYLLRFRALATILFFPKTFFSRTFSSAFGLQNSSSSSTGFAWRFLHRLAETYWKSRLERAVTGSAGSNWTVSANAIASISVMASSRIGILNWSQKGSK